MTENVAGDQTITSRQALEVAYAAIEGHSNWAGPGDVIVQPQEKYFEVVFRFLAAPSRNLDRLVRVRVDSSSGKAIKVEDQEQAEAPEDRRMPAEWENFITARQAYEIALKAMDGFENYDKSGRLTILIRESIYYVTFPLLRRPGTGSRSADYAMQVLVDARSGTVRKVFTAS
jgi:hypothetical protein